MGFIFSLFLAVGTVAQPQITIELDTAAANAILTLPGSHPTEDELARIASLPGVEALIRHGARFSPETQTRESFIAGLRAFAAGRDPQPDPFNFTRVRGRRGEALALLRGVEADPEKFKRDVVARMKPFAPADNYDTKLTLVASGTSDGFSPGRGQLYVAVDYFRDDREGLIVLAAHELYHAVQAIALDRSGVQKRINEMTGRSREALNLLLATLKEGTGSVVGDPLTVAKPGSYNTWFSEKYRRNLDRLPQNFALFETLLFRLAHDDVPFRDLYALGFSGGWDSNLYFVGYRIARILEKYDGREAVAGAWLRSPAAFFKRYAELAAQHPDDKEIVEFTPSTLKILNELEAAYAAATSDAR